MYFSHVNLLTVGVKAIDEGESLNAGGKDAIGLLLFLETKNKGIRSPEGSNIGIIKFMSERINLQTIG